MSVPLSPAELDMSTAAWSEPCMTPESDPWSVTRLAISSATGSKLVTPADLTSIQKQSILQLLSLRIITL